MNFASAEVIFPPFDMAVNTAQILQNRAHLNSRPTFSVNIILLIYVNSSQPTLLLLISVLPIVSLTLILRVVRCGESAGLKVGTCLDL